MKNICNEDFEKALTAIHNYLRENHDMMTKVIIDFDKYEIVKGVEGGNIKNAITD